MSYANYLNKLHFGSVSDGIQAMKDNEIGSQINSLDMKSLGLDSSIDKLTGQLGDLQDSTDPATTIENAISEGGAAIEGMATMKKLYSKFQDMKSKAGDKINELKGKVQDKVDELKGEAQDKVDEANDKLSGSKDGGETKSAEPDGDTSDLNDVSYTDLPPSTSTISENELGSGTFNNSEPSGTGEGSIEMTDMSKQPEVTGDHNPEIAENDPTTAGRELETDEANLNEEESGVNNTLRSDTGKLDNAIEENNSIKDDDGDAGEAGEDAEAVEEEVAEGAEEIGTELDATAIGSVAGIILNVGGLILGAVSGSEDSTTKSVDETSIQNSITADQNKINDIKQQELNIKSQIAQQHFTGANIVPNISSTTIANVTSSSF